MQAFVVRPVMTGLLALIIAGIWGTPLGTSGAGASLASSACHGVASQAPQAVIGAVICRGGHC